MNAATPWDFTLNDPDIGGRDADLFRDVVIYEKKKILYGYRGWDMFDSIVTLTVY